MNQQKNNQQNPKKQFPIMLDTSIPNPVRDLTSAELLPGVHPILSSEFKKMFPALFESTEVCNGK